jgi:hypothetical protein
MGRFLTRSGLGIKDAADCNAKENPVTANKDQTLLAAGMILTYALIIPITT